jgi:hypothetical protein
MKLKRVKELYNKKKNSKPYYDIDITTFLENASERELHAVKGIDEVIANYDKSDNIKIRYRIFGSGMHPLEWLIGIDSSLWSLLCFIVLMWVYTIPVTLYESIRYPLVRWGLLGIKPKIIRYGGFSRR